MTEAAGSFDVVVVGASAPGDAARLALALALERQLALHGGEIQRGLLRGELVAHRALAREAADRARGELAQLGALVEVRVAKPGRSSGELPAVGAEAAQGDRLLPEPPPFGALEADPERDRPLRLADLDPPLPPVEPDRSRPQGRHGGAERPFDPAPRTTPAPARRPTPANDPRRGGASQAVRRPTPMLGSTAARRSIEGSAHSSARRPTPAPVSVSGEVDTARPADPFAPLIDPISAAGRSTVEVRGEPNVEQAHARPTTELSHPGGPSSSRAPTPAPSSSARAPTPAPAGATRAPTPAPSSAAAPAAPAKPAAEPAKAPTPAKAQPKASKPLAAPAPATGPLPSRFAAPLAQDEPKLELDLDAIRATRPAAPVEPPAPMVMPSSSSQGWSRPTGPNRLLGSDPVATWLFALAIGFTLGLVVAFGVARAHARSAVDPLEIELADAYASPIDVELGDRRSPDAIEKDRRDALGGVGLRFWLVWLGVSAPVAAALAMIKRP